MYKNIDNYKVLEHIGSGSFGNVFKAIDNNTKELVALKIPIEEKNGRVRYDFISREFTIYKKLKESSKGKDYGICDARIIKHNNKKIIAMTLLGDSLSSLLNKQQLKNKHGKFHLQTVLLLGINMIKIIKYIHSCGYIHRDIKPDNFTIGYKEKNKIFCIDFGLATRYLDRHSLHYSQKQNTKFVGTARYASINAHLGNTQSRKDDLESIGYMLVYFFKGFLPWQGITESVKEKKYQLILEKKQSTSRVELCRGLPDIFLCYFQYVDSLEYDTRPRYTSIINTFKDFYNARGYKNEKYEWE
jgi:serine/threonine protein kinase